MARADGYGLGPEAAREGHRVFAASSVDFGQRSVARGASSDVDLTKHTDDTAND